MKNRLIIITRDQKIFFDKVSELNLPDLEIFAPESDEEIFEIIKSANIAFVNPPLAKKYIREGKKLEWVQSTFAGVDAFIDDSLPNNYLLTNVKDTYGIPMAEYVFTYILMFERKMLENIAWQKEAHWAQECYPILGNRTLGLLGTGSIGKKIAEVAKTFEMTVVGLRTQKQMVENFDEIYTPDAIDAFMSRSDYVVSVLPHTKNTVGFINAETLSMMKGTAVFMNIGRGSAVVDQDLVDALQSSKIKAAVLDVFNEEPLPADSPYWSLSNVYVTPHVSGYVTHDGMFRILKENYMRFIRGEELQYLVDIEKGY